MEIKPKIYLAGPYGFSELGAEGIKTMIDQLESHFNLVNPFLMKENFILGQRIKDIMLLVQDKNSEMDIIEALEELKEINHSIGGNNENEIRECDGVLAVLDGPDVDSGTAAEIGFAYALGKPVWGYKGDCRVSRDNFGANVNLQVEYFIMASGGKIFSSIEEIKDHSEDIIAHFQK